MPDEAIAVAWAGLQESYVPAYVDLNKFLQADADLVREEVTDEDIVKRVQKESAFSDEYEITAQRDTMLPLTSSVLDASFPELVKQKSIRGLAQKSVKVLKQCLAGS